MPRDEPQFQATHSEERLDLWFSARKAEAGHGLGCDIDLAADQSMRPVRSDVEGLSTQGECSVSIESAQ